MTPFARPLLVEVLEKETDGRVQARLLSPFSYTDKSGRTHVVPADFVTDFASVPRLFWRIAPPLGPYAKAAVVHDFLCLYPEDLTRTHVDTLFYQSMLDLGVSKRLAFSMWAAVRLHVKFRNMLRFLSQRA